ncbi:hypothetical protein IFM89_016404 [Coptis chinensis]|uniref:Trichome birefringence-like C-terminal domain-containing protein n=1 Tax=Coptis chinensis TaxID=261450 RepID=A0A835LIX2_9MAGN|nr:hypothetical protein IFM89_016404 [Coptis chinensis]
MVAYGFLFTVIACTVFIAFSPSSNSSAPWFNNIFSSSSTSTSYGSQLSSFFSSFFPNSSVPMLDNNPNITRSLNTTSELQKQAPPSNHTDVKQQPVLNQTVNGSSTSSSGVKNETSSMNKTVTEQSRVDNYTSSLSKQTNSNSSSSSDYNCTVEFFRSPFLVQEWELPETDGSKKETLRLDLVESSSSKYKDADYIVFNTGHWWTHEKTSKGKDYYQEGSHVYEDLNVVEAFRKALTTWARWVDANINPTKSLVLFRGYSASHFRGGQWNSGGQCNDETEPIKNNTYLSKYPPKMRVLEKVLKNMKTPVAYLNITRMTDFRKDAHPSVYRKQNLSAEERKSPLRFQDCSHWCLPGVPDSWNELLYARLLIKQQEQQQKQKQHR